MEVILEKIYNDLFDIKKDKHIEKLLERDIIKIIYLLSKYKDKKIDLKKIIEQYNKERIEKILGSSNTTIQDSFVCEKETMHFTYPIRETLNRIEVLFKITGEKMWKDIFGFDYEILYSLIIVIVSRLMYYNAYKSNVDEEFCSNYETVWEKSLNCFFTKEEFYSFFRNYIQQKNRAAVLR